MPQPEHREIWIVSFHIKEMVVDELMWFKGYKEGRSVFNVSCASDLLAMVSIHNRPLSLTHYFLSTLTPNNNYSILRKMLDPEDYEHLVSYLLWEHPKAIDKN